MAHLILTGVIRGSASTMCSFTVSADGGAFVGPDEVALDKAVFTIPDGPTTLVVRGAALDAARYGTVEGTLRVDAAGSVTRDLAELGRPQVSGAPPTIEVSVHFTPLVDVTERARDMLRPTGPDFPGSPAAPAPRDMSFRGPFVTPMPPPALGPRALADTTFIAAPPIAGGALQVVSRASEPEGSITIFEWRGVTAPRLLAVYWPRAVPVGRGAPPTPFLVYFHATAGQNTPEFYVDPRDRRDPATRSTYPFGFDYQFFGFWRYLNYDGDPLTEDPACKGLPHQIEASGKNVVLVLPLNRASAEPCAETASLNDAGALQELLEELQAWAFRRGDNYQPPGIGHLAMASFSSGHTLLSCFLSRPANQQHPLYLDVLREVYLFDPHADRGDETAVPVAQMAKWALLGQAATKVARLYTQNGVATLAAVLAQLGVPAGPVPFDATVPGNARRSVTCLPLDAWVKLGDRIKIANPYRNTGDVHQVLSALMLTDALRRSDFPAAPVRVHIRIIDPPPGPVDEMMANAQALFEAHGVVMVEASREEVASDLETLFVGDASAGEATADLTDLHESLRAPGLGPRDVLVVFVRDLAPFCRGCHGHPPDKPGVVLSARAAGPWTLAHELGHLLGLEHVAAPGNLMNASTTSIADPALTEEQVATLGESPLVA